MAVFRIEKTRDYVVMAKYHLKDKELSLKSKGLLTMMLSLPEEWNYTTRGLAAICKEGVESIGTALKELENAGYIVRNRLRDEKGRIYDTEYVIYEQPQKQPDTVNPNTDTPDKGTPDIDKPDAAKPYTDKPDIGKPDTDYPDTGNPDMDKPDMEEPYTDEPGTENSAQLNNNQTSNFLLKNNLLNINPINQPLPTSRGAQPKNEPDGIDGIDAYRELIKDNIEYDCLCSRYSTERMDEVVELMFDTVCSNRKTIRVGGEDFPAGVVKSRMLKLNSQHIEYVFDCLDKNTTKVHNIKSYLLTALYNSAATIDSFYRAEVNHDLYGGGGK